MRAPTPGRACASPKAAFAPPWLVLASESAMPLFPLDVASATGSTVAVLWGLVQGVVGDIAVGPWSDSASAWSERKTSAAPGAGTLTLQTLLVWSQFTV